MTLSISAKDHRRTKDDETSLSKSKLKGKSFSAHADRGQSKRKVPTTELQPSGSPKSVPTRRLSSSETSSAYSDRRDSETGSLQSTPNGTSNERRKSVLAQKAPKRCNTSYFSYNLRRFIPATLGRISNIITNGYSNSSSNDSNSANTTTNNQTDKSCDSSSSSNSIMKSPTEKTSSTPVRKLSSCDKPKLSPVSQSTKTTNENLTNTKIKSKETDSYISLGSSSTRSESLKNLEECPLCIVQFQRREMTYGASCSHRACQDCMKKYITSEINHSRLSIRCPVCPLHIHPNKIKLILNDEELFTKYENFMLRRVIAAEPDARWCPAPDCGYVVIASGCASCPELRCGRKGCNTTFCYHCKQEWHPDETCSAASIKRGLNNPYKFNVGDLIEDSGSTSKSPSKKGKPRQHPTLTNDDIRECPVCGSCIIKMNDGSCNHMTCSICATQFCWLCMKEISDLHYFSPSGCTFWGTKPWSRKKKILWQLGMLVGAPVCIILIAGVAIPAIIIGIPVWAGRKLRTRLEREPLSKYRKNAIVAGGVLLSLIISPLISAVVMAIGVPIILSYVYGVVPLSLCKSGGCGLSTADSFENLAQATAAEANKGQFYNRVRDIEQSFNTASIGELSLETNSTNGDGHSTRALAGSIYKESGCTLAEVHNK